ncbi:MAG TPA: hypothetical protein VN868_06655, partial [Terriglobales bacterium]|nr:hypothetical protein [Terriglobales bacterium]
EQIGKAVQACVEKRCELADLPLEELRQLNPTFDPDFYSCLSLQAVLNLHDVPGGTAPARVRQALAEARRRVESMREEVHAHA